MRAEHHVPGIVYCEHENLFDLRAGGRNWLDFSLWEIGFDLIQRSDEIDLFVCVVEIDLGFVCGLKLTWY